jgi:hypothetical protein
MSTLLSTRTAKGGAVIEGNLTAIDRADITITLITPGATDGRKVIGIAKTFSFNINKPKAAIEVLSQLTPAGYARSPEDRTFTMNQVNTFENLEDMSTYTNATKPFEIEITYVSASNQDGTSAPDHKTKILLLKGVEFESVASSMDSGGSEYTLDFSGKFRSSELTTTSNDENPI